MTRQENILTLNEHLDHWKRLLSEKICDQDEGEKTIDALQNAINALEQEPCGDCISRDKAIVQLRRFLSDSDDDWNVAIRKCIEDIKKLPSVTPQPCDDAVSRQAVLEAIDVKAWEFCDYLIRNGRNDEQKPVSHFADNLRECVGKDLPSVTPQPKMERWIEHIHNGIHYIECSKCSSWFLRMYLTRNSYCPNCGAKMQEVEE